jgi:hypothetical protein
MTHTHPQGKLAGQPASSREGTHASPRREPNQSNPPPHQVLRLRHALPLLLAVCPLVLPLIQSSACAGAGTGTGTGRLLQSRPLSPFLQATCIMPTVTFASPPANLTPCLFMQENVWNSSRLMLFLRSFYSGQQHTHFSVQSQQQYLQNAQRLITVLRSDAQHDCRL